MTGQTIVDYPSLEQAVQDWLDRSDITDATYAPEIIQIAQTRIYRGYVDNKGEYWPGLRVRQMETQLPGGSVASVAIVGGTGYAVTDTVTFAAAPAGGITATGTLVVTNGAITGVNFTNPGLLYTTAPLATINTSTGSGGSITATLSSTAQTGPAGLYAVPSDYLELINMQVELSGSQIFPLDRMGVSALDAIYGGYPDVGIPNAVARNGVVFNFGPSPDSQYGLSGSYYAQPAMLSDANPTNILTSQYPDVLLAAALTEASAFIGDEQRLQYWEGRLSSALRLTQAQNREERHSGGSPRMLVS